MIPSRQITLEKLGIAPRYAVVLDYHDCNEGESLLYALEQYKILDRESIVTRLNSLLEEPDDYVFIVDDEKIYTLGVTKVADVDRLALLEYNDIRYYREDYNKSELPEVFREVENYNNVHLELNNNMVFVCYSVLDNIDFRSIQIALSDYSIRFIPVTPMNLDELRGLPEKPRDLVLLFRRLIIECIEKGGSDFKLDVVYENLLPKVRVRFRVDETVIDCDKFDISVEEEEQMILSMLESNCKDVLIEQIKSGPIEGSIDNILCTNRLEARFGIFKSTVGYFINIRLREAEEVERTVDELGLDYHTVEAIEYAQQKLQGLTLITGPAKSGKTTTMWGMMTAMSKLPIQCVEYSNPVEAKMPLPQVTTQTNGVLLQQLLRVAKKQDINVAFLNEIPDSITALGVRDLVNSNIHVVSTFHINRIWHLPNKLSEYYGSEFKEILSQINLVVNQKMYVKQCPHCRYVMLTDNLPRRIREFLESNGISRVYGNKGCDYCNNGEMIGGRQPFAEYLEFTQDLIEELRQINNPLDMEVFLKEYLFNNEEYKAKKVALEYKLLDAIKEGKLSYKCLFTIL